MKKFSFRRTPRYRVTVPLHRKPYDLIIGEPVSATAAITSATLAATTAAEASATAAIIGGSVGIGTITTGAELAAVTAAAAGAQAAASSALTQLAIGAALSITSSIVGMLTAPKIAAPSVTRNGQLVNTRAVTEPVKVVYGQCRVGGNWVFAQPSGNHNKFLNVCITWSEGEIEGYCKAVDPNPSFKGKGVDDMKSGGAYTGTSNKYRVKIYATGTPDTFDWSDDGGTTWEATAAPVSITGGWQDLNNGVKIKFVATTGHTLNDYWSFMAGDAFWLGNSIVDFYRNFMVAGGSESNLVPNHEFYYGTSTQTASAALATECPAWNDPLHYTSYSWFQLKYWADASSGKSAWDGIPEFTAYLKGRKIYDPRDGQTAYTHLGIDIGRNPALVTRDFLTNGRYGLGIDTSLIDDTSIGDAATWCESNSYYFDGAVLDRKAFIDHLQDILANFRAYIVWSGGKYRLKVYADDAPVMSLTEDDIEITPSSFQIKIPGIPETPNKVKCIYSNAQTNFVSDFSTWEDNTQIPLDGEARTIEIPLTGTTSFTQATKLAKYFLRRQRCNKTFQLLCHPRCFALEPGDMVQITHEFPGWTNYKLRVMDIAFPQGGLIPITFMDEDTDIYDQTVNIAPEEAWPVFFSPKLPDMTGFTPSVTSIKRARGLFVDWSAWDDQDFPDITKYGVYYSLDSTCPTTALEFYDYTRSGAVRTMRILGLTPGATYYVRVVPYSPNGVGTPSEVA